MKINGHIISSLESLKLNFDFIEIWHKREISYRDLSPKVLYYPDKRSERLYQAYHEPEKVEYENKVLLFDDGERIAISMNEKEVESLAALEAYTPQERIQIIALHKLAGKELNPDISSHKAVFVCETDVEIIIEGGDVLQCFPEMITDGEQLCHKVIKVSGSAKHEAVIGPYKLAPGKATYGIFCAGHLVAVAPPRFSNGSYYLEYSVQEDGRVLLEAYDKYENALVAVYRNAHFYCPLGESDFAVIEGLRTFCLNNLSLNNRLRKFVRKVKMPEFMLSAGGFLNIWYKDGTQEHIEL